MMGGRQRKEGVGRAPRSQFVRQLDPIIIIAGQSRCVNSVIVALPLDPVGIVSRDVDD